MCSLVKDLCFVFITLEEKKVDGIDQDFLIKCFACTGKHVFLSSEEHKKYKSYFPLYL